MGSSRLPGKVLKRLGRASVLAQVISRVQRCRLVDDVIVATTTNRGDDVVVEESRKHGAAVHRGSEEDVLARYYGAALGADVVVRVTSDCPLFDPDLLTRILTRFRERRANGRVDYLSNTVTRSFPRGLDAEVFTYAALERAHVEAQQPYEREHVTPYLYHHPELFALEAFVESPDLSSHRWTLDTPDDFALLTAIYGLLATTANQDFFSTAAVLELLQRRPQLNAINAHVEQKPIRSGT